MSKERTNKNILRRDIKLGFLVSIIILVISFLFIKPVLAASNSIGWDTSFDITAYDVDVKVNTDNILDVTETIMADFHEEKHGIYRNIPLASKVEVSKDDSVAKTYIKDLNNIMVTDETGKAIPYEKSRENDDLVLKIGDLDKTLTGKKTYVIKYSYNIGDDKYKEYDELYYNLIGYGWDAAISNVTFKVHMPKDFDKSNINVTTGFSSDSSEAEKVPYEVKGNTISGKVNALFLPPGEGVTINIKLPEGYFSGFKQKNDNNLIYVFGIFIIISLFLFIIFGRNKRIKSLVSGIPPEDLNPAEAGYLIDGNIVPRHAVSLIIYWANKGYLNILNDDANNFILTKLKEADNEMRDYEKRMFDKLFEGRERVTAKELDNNFYYIVSNVNARVVSSFKTASRRLYRKAGTLAQWCSYIFAGLSIGLMVGITVGTYDFSLGSGIAAGMLLFFITLFFAAIIGYIIEVSIARSKKIIIITIIIYLIFLTITAMVATDYTSTIEAYGSVSAAFICSLLGANSRKRTEQYDNWLSRLIGLKKFIKNDEKNEANVLVQRDILQAYDILPYAYSFGISKAWGKKFSDINLKPPSWFKSNEVDAFSCLYFMMLFNINMKVYEKNMTSSPHDDSYSSGGGGDAGGGFGGGGGGSW